MEQWTRLTKRNHYEEIADRIRSLIAEGQLKPGDKLPSTKELSERFGVGRSTTREALSALKAMGLIEIRQGGGCTVLNGSPVAPLGDVESLRMNRTLLLELLEARQSLEVSNAALAAERRTEEDLAALEKLVGEMEGSIGDDREGERTDLLFHELLARMTHNSIMVRLFESIVGQLETSIRDVRRVELYANRSVSERLYREHRSLFEAVKAGDAAKSARRMKAHLEHVRSILTKYV